MKSFLRKIIPQWVVNKSKHLPMAILANFKYGFPAKKLTVIGVTGTDGKTTTVNMIYHILKSAGKKVSMISTINAVIGDKTQDIGFHVTSPDPMDVQKYLKEAVQAGSEYMVLEVSSHSLDQYRFWGVKFDVGVITNITHDHLDYHKTWENYLLAKTKIIKNARVAVLYQAEKHFKRAEKIAKGKVVSFGLTKNADFNPVKFPLKIGLLGEFNLLNALATSAVAVNLGIDSKTVKKSLEEFKSLNGRMEFFENELGIKIVIDFAATPNSLENSLKTLRRETKDRLISVFGSAGLRDVEKRSMMGEISAKYADMTVVTAEDPRGHLDEINEQIKSGAEKAGGKIDENLFVIPDRKEAIRFAIKDLAKKGDLVGVFGKSHEKSMNLDGKNEIPWSDKEAIERVLLAKSEARNTKSETNSKS